MTLMLIFGAVAAFYCLLLLFRCATYALPVFAGLGLAFTVRDHGFSWMVILAAGLLAGVAVHALGRHLARSSAPLALRLGVILTFVGAAAAAGFQAGAAIAVLADLDTWMKRGISILTAFVTGYSGWRNLLSPAGVPRCTASVHSPLILLRFPDARRRIHPPVRTIAASRHAPSLSGPLR